MRAFDVLVLDSSVADESVGFHAQQMVEKCLKAVLALHRVEFRKVHDLGSLIELLAKSSLPMPPDADRLDELNPYAVLLRYDLVETQTLDRDRAKQTLVAVLAWAKKQLDIA